MFQCIGNAYGKLRLFLIETLEDTLTDHGAVLVRSGRQHDDELVDAVARKNVAASERARDSVRHTVHGFCLVRNRILPCCALKRYEAEENGKPASCGCPGLDPVKVLEYGVFALISRTLGIFLF